MADRVNYMVKRDAFYCSAWSKCFKRAIVENNNIKFEKGLLGEDQEWYYHILCHIKSIEFIILALKVLNIFFAINKFLKSF